MLDKEFDGYWMQKAYRIPDNDCACTPVGKAPEKTRPIGRYNVRSFITSADGARLPLGQAQRVRGIAFDGGRGIREVQFSADGGKTGAPRNWARTWGATPSANGRRTSGRNGRAPTS